jgi:hypothetical protein
VRDRLLRDRSNPRGDISPTTSKMDFPQSTLEEIIESERTMALAARERFGRFYSHARGSAVFLSLCITTIEHDRMMFGRLFSFMKKHAFLALLSAVRLHKVQSMMNLCQVLEAGASAAFAIANPEREHFAGMDEQGILDPSPSFAKKRYQWLHEHYFDKSNWIRETKDRINSSTAHANVISADSVFRIVESGDEAKAPFFDIEDEYHIKADLWLMASVSITLMDSLYGVNQSLDVIGFRAGFGDDLSRFAAESNGLLAEMKKTDRYRATMEKFGKPQE